MKIECPHCSCTREMPEDRIPDGILTARCPACGQAFRFSKQELKEKEAEAAREAERRGPGAVRLSDMEDGFTGGAAGSAPEKTPSAETEGTASGESRTEEQARSRGEAAGRCAQDDGADRQERRARERNEESEGEWSFNPWECARTFQDYPPALYQTCLRVMFAAQRFFSGIRPGPVMRALAFFLTVCVLQTVIEHVWTVFFFDYLMPIGESTDPELKQLAALMQDNGNLLMTVLLRCAVLTLQLYVFTAILYLCWRLIAGRGVDFSVVLQVLCYSEAPLLLCIIPGVGTIVGVLWSCVACLVGSRAALGLSWGQTIAGVMPLLLLLIFSYSQFMSMLG
ncbi:MAG: YIP1 family protein [Desulfovibrionaceae bacterium]|nr:YIP1 family protein [Desulfovibrionaceae bacterium]